MMKFIMKNKLQFVIVILSNLALYLLIIGSIVIQNMTTDSMTLFESILLGILSTHLFIIMAKKVDKSKRLRLLLGVLIYILGLRYISTFILDPSEVLTVAGILIGFLIYVYVWNTADTIHNIRVKSGLVLTDLEK